MKKMFNKKIIITGVLSIFALAVLLTVYKINSYATEPQNVNIDWLSVKDVPGFYVGDKIVVAQACHGNAYQRWDGYKWVIHHKEITSYYPEYLTARDNGFDDQTPQDGSNEYKWKKKAVPEVKEGEAWAEDKFYLAYEADYWAFMVLYTPNVPVVTTGKVTVKYVNEATSMDIAAPTVYSFINPGINAYDAKNITGYVLNDTSPKTVDVEAGKEYTVTFKYKTTVAPTEGKGAVTVKYVDISTQTEIITADVFTNVAVGDQTYSAKIISGYNIQSPQTQSTITVEAGKSYLLTFYYAKDVATLPPTAELSAPPIVMAGDDCVLTGIGHDPQGYDLLYTWYIEPNDDSVHEVDMTAQNQVFKNGEAASITVWFSKEGTYYSRFTVIQIIPMEDGKNILGKSVTYTIKL